MSDKSPGKLSRTVNSSTGQAANPSVYVFSGPRSFWVRIA